MFLNVLPWALVAILCATILFFVSFQKHSVQKADSPFPLAWIQASQNNQTLRAVVWLLMVVIVCQAAAIATIFPLKSTEFVFAEFPQEGNHFVKITRANESISANQNLIGATLRHYVYIRESIDKQTEKIRYPHVAAMSSKKVLAVFKEIQKPLYKVDGLTRQVVIESDTPIAKGIHQIEYVVIDRIDGKMDPLDPSLPWERRTEFEATITYHFEPQTVSRSDRYNNPIGLIIDKWTRSKRELL